MYSNIMEIKFPNKSDNERFARSVAAAFVLELDPTVDQKRLFRRQLQMR